jgi:hypothetical protein
VVGEQRGALIELVGVELGDSPGDRGVGRRTALGELRAVCDLLRERMLERVLRLWVERFS